jgi:stage IV sporulation protein FB
MRNAWPRPHPILLALVALGLLLGQGTVTLIYLGSLLLHESSHMSVARALGLHVARVDLYPFGGQAEIPDLELAGPLAEVLVAVAGPLANLAAIGVAAAMLRYRLALPLRGELLLDVNALMLAVNLLPAYPLDGGRIWHALRARTIGWTPAGREAIALGRLVAVLLAGLGVLAQLMGYAGWEAVVLAGIILWAQRGAERRMPLSRWALWLRALAALSRGEVLPLQAFAAASSSELRHVLRRLFGGRAHRVYIYEGGRVVGALDDQALYEAAQKGELRRPLGEILRREARDSGTPRGSP